MSSPTPNSRIATVTIDLVDRIDALLPQTQCGLCKTSGCRPYAEQMAQGEAINHCVPGGIPTIQALARLLQVPAPEQVDPDYGITPSHRLVAFIREDECIGCTKCIQACPVDAIVGAAKLMHTIIEAECTGCNLCVAPCPVDCIDLVPGADIPLTWHPPQNESADALQQAKNRADKARERFLARNSRLALAAEALAKRKAEKAKPALTDAERSALMIAAAMARSQLKKAEKQLSALHARGENSDALLAQLPELRAAAQAAQDALEKSALA
jgi:electron transport complex protein RnfB